MLKKLRIYVDTSVIGGCFDPEFATWSNGLFKDFENGIYRPVLSETVAFEINRAPSRVIEKYFELLSYQVEIVEITPEVVALADLYVARNILTEKCYDDTTHIALATVHHIDTLVSWNFRQIVHWDKIRRFHAVNFEQGYQLIPIHSPREVTTHGTTDTIGWIRQIRDEHYELLKDKTTEEIIAIYREGARRVHERARQELEAKKLAH